MNLDTPQGRLAALIVALGEGDEQWEGVRGDFAALFPKGAPAPDPREGEAFALAITGAQSFTLTRKADGARLAFTGSGADLWAREAFAMLALRSASFDLDSWAGQFQDERWRR